mmetsp:Transcript_56517/g.128494  ORF Transcript_56517/g.128494 Transcript_56517/m.128494 type:complete len:306 (-) Transcript_56517:84-1001(-)
MVRGGGIHDRHLFALLCQLNCRSDDISPRVAVQLGDVLMLRATLGKPLRHGQYLGTSHHRLDCIQFHNFGFLGRAVIQFVASRSAAQLRNHGAGHTLKTVLPVVTSANVVPASRRPILGCYQRSNSPIPSAIFKNRTSDSALLILQMRFFGCQLVLVTVLLGLLENTQFDRAMPLQQILVVRAEPRKPHADGRNRNLCHRLLVHPLIENAGRNRQKMQNSSMVFVDWAWSLSHSGCRGCSSTRVLITTTDGNHKLLKNMLVGLAELHACLHGFSDGRPNHVDDFLGMAHMIIPLIPPILRPELAN